jgi:hypothetical protein
MFERIKDMLFTSQRYHNEDFSRLKMVTGSEEGRAQGIAPTMVLRWSQHMKLSPGLCYSMSGKEIMGVVRMSAEGPD